MSVYYYDNLVDCALLIGANEVSGLVPPQNASNRDHDLSASFQQQILSAVSSTVAMFPFSSSTFDYPPKEFRKYNEKGDSQNLNDQLKRQVSQNEFQTIHDLVTKYNKSDSPGIGTSLKVSRRSSKYRSKRRSIKNISFDDVSASWGSVSLDTIKSFPATYFNNNLHVSSTHVAPLIKFLLMTDHMGNRSFAIILQFHRKFSVALNQHTSSTLGLKTLTKESENVADIVYVPSNIVFFSKYPFFDLFRDIFSQLHAHICDTNTDTINNELMEYTSILTRVPIIKSESLEVKFSIHGDLFSIKRVLPLFNDFIVDWDMSILFQILSIDNIISILMAMFQEQKIVFLANDSNVTTVVTETLLLLFRPFLWKHFYLTSTPSHLYELVDAICPFILGIPYAMKPKIVECYPDVIVVDLEEGIVSIPKLCQLKSVSPSLIEQLKKNLRQRDWISSTKLVSTLNPLSLEESKRTSDSMRRLFSAKVLTIFMTFMVDLFHEVIGNTSVEKKNQSDQIVANLERFLNTSHSPNIAFFREISRTDNLHCFIDDKLWKKTVDSWTIICNQRYPDLLNESRNRVRPTLRTDSDAKSIDIDMVTALEGKIVQQEVIFPTSKHLRNNYYGDLIENISRLKPNTDIRKLKAEMYLHSGDVLRSMQEYYNIIKSNPTELNYSKLRKIIRGMRKNDLLQLKHLAFHTPLFESISFDERRDTVSQIFEKHNVEQFIPPTVAIARENFIDECRKANIAEHDVTMNTLFNCLTIDQKSAKGRIKTVLPKIFKTFYSNWITFTIDLSDVEMPTEPDDDILIKGTETCVKVDGFGMGRVILTQHRLLFIGFGKSRCETIVMFRENRLLKLKMERKIRGFGKATEVLELTFKDRDSKVVIWFPESTETWYQCISEINFVSLLAQQEKDESLLDLVTEHCLLYENMLCCSKKSSFFKNNISEIGKKMLPHSVEKNRAPRSENINHRKYLIRKLMPSAKQSVTIDCAIDIYKPQLSTLEIWCACVSRNLFFVNILQICDNKLTDKRKSEILIEIPTRVQCMIQIPTRDKVVVCSLSHVVKILGTYSHLSEEEFLLDIGKGSYPICCTSSINDPELVYFGTNNGEIVSRNFQTNKNNKVMTLVNDEHISSMRMYDSNTIVVLSLYCVYVVGTNGEVINIIRTSEFSNIKTKVNCMILSNDNLTLLVGMARLPVVLEYDITDVRNVACLRKRNTFTDKEFFEKDVSECQELSQGFVGISSMLLTERDTEEKHLWLIFKDGSIGIRDYRELTKVAKFNGHVEITSACMLCRSKELQFITTVGREDGKVILWNLSSLH